MQIEKSLKEDIDHLFNIPCVPFSFTARSKYIKSVLKNKGINDIQEDEHSIIAKTGSKNPKHRIFLTTHLDHPGFIFKSSSEAIGIGTLYFNQIDLKETPKIQVYDTKGNPVCKTSIKKVTGKDFEKILIEPDRRIKRNYYGVWDLVDTKFSEECFWGRSNDNDLPTSILLNNITQIDSVDYQFIFVFTKNEEVVQLGSYIIAKDNLLGVTDEDILINLESMKVYDIDSKISDLNYDSGLVLNISERGLIYANSQNLSETVINNLCKKIGISIQHGLAGGSTDAWPFAKYKLTPNIVTINIPNQYKHNVNNRRVTLEKANWNDILDLNKILRNLIQSVDQISFSKNSRDHDYNKEQIGFGNHIVHKDLLLKRLSIAYKNKAERGYFWPKRLGDYFLDTSYKIFSYFVYYFYKSKDNIDTRQRIE